MATVQSAKALLENREAAAAQPGPYKIVWDATSAFDVTQLEAALNYMAAHGWRTVNITTRTTPVGVSCVYALLEKE